MKKAMTKREITKLWNALNNRKIAGLKGAKFAFVIEMNKAEIKPTIDALETAQKKALESIRDYEEARRKLCEEYAEKDENGKPVIVEDEEGNKQFFITENREEFDNVLEALGIEFHEAIEEGKRLGYEFEELLSSEEEVDIRTIKLSDVPKDITVGAMQGLMPMISEE